MGDDKDRSRERSRRDRPTRFSEASRDRSLDRGRDRGSMKSSNNRVYVSNIPYEYRWQDMKDLFRSEVGDVQFVELFVDDNDKPKGCGIVEFSESSSVKKCMEVMQRFEVKGRKLVIREDSGNKRDKHGNIMGPRGGGGGGGRDEGRYRDDRDRFDNHGGSMRQDDGKWGNTFGLSIQFLESLNIDPPLSNRVFVANLEYNIDKKKLKDVFRLAGKVQRVEIPIDKDGRSRGFAVIEYDHPVEAVQAISMLHNQVLYDRHMTVRMDRANENVKLPEGLKSIGMGLGTNGEPLKNVSLNLPSLSAQNQVAQVGAGILGAVPNSALQVANALSNLNNPLSQFSNQASVLQAANLSSLLGNGLSNTDLSLASSLVSNPLVNVNNQSQMPGGGNGGSNMSSNNIQPFSRNDNNYQSNQNSGYGQNPNQNFQNRGTFQSSFESQKPNQFGNFGGGGSNDRNSNFTNSSSMMRSSPQSDSKGVGSVFNRKVLVSNLPPHLSYNILHEKFSEFGDIHLFEEKGVGNIIIEFASQWQAESAIKNLHRARIDGRTIEARLC
ncbi:unnamed protein product [Brassicogethes aeneus]|uniref:RRM domain-containing protein n=1 Tax=Brassicogethes aeneus TaxID=1431903 RepID=A0A9P0B2A1_BRAAE|nr:unnamed protein product [Brassicogethes aeneus]